MNVSIQQERRTAYYSKLYYSISKFDWCHLPPEDDLLLTETHVEVLPQWFGEWE